MIKNVLTISAICAALLCSAVSLSAETPVERHGKLKTKGGYLLDEHDSIVQLRGMSFYWSTNGWIGTSWYNTGTVDALVDYWKCTVIRIAYDTKDNWGLCQTVLDRAISKGIYAIIDWHSHNAETQESAAVNFFKEKAKQYKNVPNVIFEPYNEPKWSGGAKEKVGDLANALLTWKAIKPYLKNVTKAIRAEGAENLVILGTPYFAQFVNVAANDQVVDDAGQQFSNVAYTFHFYAASHGPEAYFVKNGQGDGGMEPSYLGPALGKVPVFITEWGTTHSDGGQRVDCPNTEWWFSNWVDKYHLSHCNWSACSGETSSAFGGSATSPSESGNCAKKYIAVSTKDYWALPDLAGKPGPAGDSSFAMPGTHPTVGYNKYWGANFASGSVPFSLRDDKTNVRTSKNTAINVSGNVGADEWVEYNIKSSSATSHILLRYVAVKGTGTANILLDGKSIGTASFTATPSDSTWGFIVVPAAVGSGDHKLRFEFASSNGEGYYLSWFELTNDSKIPSVTVSRVRKIKLETAVAISASKSGIIVNLPQLHPYQSYTLFGVDGRAVTSAQLSKSTEKITISTLSSGTYFIKFLGKEFSITQKVVLNSK
jgi:endoglucanase